MKILFLSIAEAHGRRELFELRQFAQSFYFALERVPRQYWTSTRRIPTGFEVNKYWKTEWRPITQINRMLFVWQAIAWHFPASCTRPYHRIDWPGIEREPRRATDIDENAGQAQCGPTLRERNQGHLWWRTSRPQFDDHRQFGGGVFPHHFGVRRFAYMDLFVC